MHHFVCSTDHFLYALVRILGKGLSWLMSSVITAVTAAFWFLPHCSAVAATLLASSDSSGALLDAPFSSFPLALSSWSHYI